MKSKKGGENKGMVSGINLLAEANNSGRTRFIPHEPNRKRYY